MICKNFHTWWVIFPCRSKFYHMNENFDVGHIPFHRRYSCVNHPRNSFLLLAKRRKQTRKQDPRREFPILQQLEHTDARGGFRGIGDDLGSILHFHGWCSTCVPWGTLQEDDNNKKTKKKEKNEDEERLKRWRKKWYA